MLNEINANTTTVITELLNKVLLRPELVLVVGCSTSEVSGHQIGTAGSVDIANVILTQLRNACQQRQIQLAIQCCEHLNRALVVEQELLIQQRLTQVSALPIPTAGGALAAAAVAQFKQPVLVEQLQADIGLDIGLTLIGMHLKPVVVPVRLTQTKIGQALVNAAFSRPKLIGGERAVYR